MFRNRLSTAFVLVLAISASRFARGDMLLEVAAGKHERIATPVSLELRAPLKDHKHFTLTRLEDGQQVPVQVTNEETPHVVWLLQRPLPAGAVRRYRLSPAKAPQAKASVTVEHDGGRLQVAVGGKPVVVYNTALVLSPNRNESHYDRSGYIHPLFNPRGQAITDDFAPDHPHQHGIMFPWTNTKFEGRSLNFWEQRRKTAKIEHASVEATESGAVCGGFTASLKHLDLTDIDKHRPVLKETWRVRVYNSSDYFLFDLESKQRAVGNPLHIEKHHYGGLAIRGHRNWLNPGEGDFLTSENKNRENGNQSRPRWCDIFGNVDGETTGVTIFCDPDNFRAPQPVRLHPNKPYFCFAPMSLGAFKIEAGTPYVSRFRFYVHNGPLDVQTAERIWNDLADPPRITISE